MMKLPAKVGVLVLDLLAAVLVLYSVSLIFLSNFNMGNLMVWLLTACVAGYAVFRRPLSLWFSAGAGRVVFWVLAVLAGVYLALIAFVSVSGYMHPPTGDERVIIVLGAGLHKDKPSKLLQCRLNKAYDYAAAAAEFNDWLPGFMAKMRPGDILMVTADHGCDPSYTKTTDHTREHVPFLIYGDEVKPGVNLHTRYSFATIADTVCKALGVDYCPAGCGVYDEIAR